MSDAGSFSAQTGGTHEDLLASTQHHATAGSVQSYGNVPKRRRLPRAWVVMRRQTQSPARTAENPRCSVSCSAETQPSSARDRRAAAGLLHLSQTIELLLDSLWPRKGFSCFARRYSSSCTSRTSWQHMNSILKP